MNEALPVSEPVSTSTNDLGMPQEGPVARQHLVSRLLPGLLGVGLYIINNLDVIHGLIAPPNGYLPLGVQRNPDVALYVCWLQGLKHSWFIPNYHAPWITPRNFTVPAFFPAALLQRILPISAAFALQIFTLAAYVFLAYAAAFACRSFCKTRRQALWSLLVAACCVPVASLPGLSHVSGNPDQYGEAVWRGQFLLTSDGFFHGLVTWPFMTLGTAFQVLSMAFLVRYLNAPERRWFVWLTITCLISTLMHPFEIIVTLTAAGVVLLRQFGLNARTVARVGLLAGAAAIGMLPYVIQTLRIPWVHEIAQANMLQTMPAPLLLMLGVPTILVVVLLILGYPQGQSHETLVLKAWFLSTFLVFFIPGVPFAFHALDGLFFAIGFLLWLQIQELTVGLAIVPSLFLRVASVVFLAWSLIPHATLRWQAWNARIAPQDRYGYPPAIAPAAEFATIQWLRENSGPDDLVLATYDAAPWLATAPVHSFASHWLFSLGATHPRYSAVRNAFFDGSLTPEQAHDLLQLLGVRFVVVPDGSPATRYLENAVQRARFNTWTIFDLPGAHMKPYRDSGILALAGPPY